MSVSIHVVNIRLALILHYLLEIWWPRSKAYTPNTSQLSIYYTTHLQILMGLVKRLRVATTLLLKNTHVCPIYTYSTCTCIGFDEASKLSWLLYSNIVDAQHIALYVLINTQEWLLYNTQTGTSCALVCDMYGHAPLRLARGSTPENPKSVHRPFVWMYYEMSAIINYPHSNIKTNSKSVWGLKLSLSLSLTH